MQEINYSQVNLQNIQMKCAKQISFISTSGYINALYETFLYFEIENRLII